ncbi:Glucose-6-phosphate 1-dehydrogenase [compost metagenome]
MNIRHDSANPDLPEAYENLIYDAMLGDATFFAHWEEVELSWQWVQPIIEATEEGALPLHTYASGSYGPDAARTLLGDHHWWLDDSEADSRAKHQVVDDGDEEEQVIRPGA